MLLLLMKEDHVYKAFLFLKSVILALQRCYLHDRVMENIHH